MANDSIPQKLCTKCGVEKPATLEYFHKRKKSIDGLRHTCKACRNTAQSERDRERRQNDPDYAAQKRERNRVHLHAPGNLEKHCAREKERYALKCATDPSFRAVKNEKVRLRRVTDDAFLDKERKYWRQRIKLPVLKAKREVIRQRRNERIAENGGSYTAQEIRTILYEQEGRCGYCGITLYNDYHIDHYLPVAHGGSSWASNLVLACPSCSLNKGAKLFNEWQEMRGW